MHTVPIQINDRLRLYAGNLTSEHTGMCILGHRHLIHNCTRVDAWMCGYQRTTAACH